jgi:tetratricopeptide (TPR) repeat protein
LTEHLAAEDLAKFASGGLSAEKRRWLIRHLVAGCPQCARTLAARGGVAPAAVPTDTYDGPVERAMARACRVAAGRRKALAILTSLLSGERTWQMLTAAEVAALGRLPQVGALVEAGRSMRHHDPLAALQFAKLARYAAARLRADEFGRRPVADLRALVWAELGNSYRVTDDLVRAGRAFNRAIYWSRRGSRSNLLLARIADLLTSLLCAQRRFAEALDVMMVVFESHAAEGRNHLAGRALIGAANAANWLGDTGQALAILRRGFDLLDYDRDPHLAAQAVRNMLSLLVDLGHFRAARRLLWRGRQLFTEHGNAQDLLRIRWMEGRIYAGLDDFARAEEAFKESRAGLAELGQIYVSALAGLDLAALWARQGRVEEIYALATEMIATFRAMRVAREAIVSLLILQRACGAEGAQLLEIIDVVVSFLKDLEQQPARRDLTGST